MPKLNQKGGVFIVLILLFFAVSGTAGYFVFNYVSNSAKKINQKAEVLSVTLNEEYNNPFDKESQYVNPFDDYKNPFDELK